MNWNYLSFGYNLTKTVLPSNRKDTIDAIYCNQFKVRLEFLCGRRKWYECVDTSKLLRSCNKSNLLTTINDLVADQLNSACVESYLIYAKKCLIDFSSEYVVFSVFTY